MTSTEAQLKDRDYTLLIDKSGSMGEHDAPKGSRWDYCQEATLGLANKINTLDPDGITVIAFSSKFQRYENVTPAKVKQVFTENEPNGGTDMAGALKAALENYFDRKKAGTTKANGEMFLVVTDGVPDDEEAVAKVIVNATKKIDRDEEIGISFIQVGKDSHASAYLKRLDDHLTKEGAKYDIVNTLTIEEMGDKSLTDVLIAALDD